MEIQVQELLERIRNEGIETAKKQAEEIIEKAQAQADEIIARAKKEAEEALTEAERRIASMDAASRESLLQASRDTMIALKQSMRMFVESALNADIEAAFDAKMAAQVMPEIVRILASSQSGDIEVLLPPTLEEKIDASIAARLSKELARGITFKPYPAIDAGFRVAVEGSAVQFDFTSESIAQILSVRVNRLLAEYLKEASGSLT